MKRIGLLIILVMMASVFNVVRADMIYTQENPNENIKDFEFTVLGSEWVTDSNGYVDYMNAWKIIKVQLKNNLVVPNLLVDDKDPTLAYDTNKYNMTVNTTENTTQIIPGLPESKSGVYHYGYATVGDVYIKFYVIDRYNEGVYDTVALDINADYTIDAILDQGETTDVTYKMDYQGTEMTVHIKLTIVTIDSSGNFVDIKNAYSTLREGDPSPLGDGYLEAVPQAQWVLTPPLELGMAINDDKIYLAIPLENGTYRYVTSSDKASLIVDENGDYRILAELGGMDGDKGIPPVREFWIIAQPVPPTVTITREVVDNVIHMYVKIENNAGTDLPKGYIRVENIVPISYEVNILQAVGAEVHVVYGATGKDMLIEFPSLATGVSNVYVQYEIVDKVLEEVSNTSQGIDQISQKIDESTDKVVNTINATVVAKLDEIINSTQQATTNLGQVITSLSDISTSLGDISNDLSDIKSTLDTIVTLIQTQGGGISADTDTMRTMYEAKYSALMSSITNLQNQIQQQISASENPDESLVIANQELAALLNELNSETLNPDSLPDDPFVLLMAYVELTSIEDKLSGIKTTMAINTIKGALTASGDISELKSKVNNIYNEVLTIEELVANAQSGGTSSTGGTTGNETGSATPIPSNMAMILGLLLIVGIGAGFFILKRRGAEEEEEEEEELEEFLGAEQGGFGGGMGGVQQFGGAPQGGQFGYGQYGQYGQPAGGQPGQPAGGQPLGVAPVGGTPGQFPGGTQSGQYGQTG